MELAVREKKKQEREFARLKRQLDESQQECSDLRRKVRELEREVKRKTFA
jgi:predicted RNase H-like nuclease (RuvC/YqgF family)